MSIGQRCSLISLPEMYKFASAFTVFTVDVDVGTAWGKFEIHVDNVLNIYNSSFMESDFQCFPDLYSNNAHALLILIGHRQYLTFMASFAQNVYS